MVRGLEESVCEDFRRINPMLLDIILEASPSQFEVSNDSCDNFRSAVIAIQTILPRITIDEREDLGILVALIKIYGCHTGVLKAVERLSATSGRLESIGTQLAFIHCRNCLSMLRLLLKLKSSPFDRIC